MIRSLDPPERKFNFKSEPNKNSGMSYFEFDQLSKERKPKSVVSPNGKCLHSKDDVSSLDYFYSAEAGVGGLGDGRVV